VREQGVEGGYQTQQKKDGFPLVEKDKYKCYYREYFFSPGKKEDLMRTTHTIAHTTLTTAHAATHDHLPPHTRRNTHTA
jgi:hypothetical protein